MRFFINLVRAKWFFKKPNKKNILVYDRVSEKTSRLLFPKNGCEFLDARYESINLYIMYLALKNFGIKDFNNNYKKAFIKYVAPKIVYTAIDNNPAFFKLKNIYDKPCYISDQNGLRNNMFYEECKKYIRKTKNKLKADHIFVLGNNEKERISKIIKGKIHTFGSTKNNHYPIKLKKNKKKITSIMFISSGLSEEFLKWDKIIFGHLIKFSKLNKIRLYYLDRPYQYNRVFSKSNFPKGNWVYLSNTKSVKKRYNNLNKQQMVVFGHTTLGFEALARGLKCAAFDKYFPLEGSNKRYPKSGIFWSNSNKYHDLEKILNRVIGFSNKRWKKIAYKYSTEILTYDPANIKKKKILKKILKETL